MRSSIPHLLQLSQNALAVLMGATTSCAVIVGATGELYAQRSGVEIQAPVASNSVFAEIERAESFLRQGQHDDAIEIMVRLIETAGGELVEVARGDAWRPLRAEFQRRMTRLARESPAWRIAYRRQMDGLAQQWFEDGQRRSDHRPLQRVVDELLASSYGDDALLLLGDMAMQAGRYDQARHYWERIHVALRVPKNKPEWLRTRTGAPLWRVASHVDIAVDTGEDEAACWAELQQALQEATPSDRIVAPNSELPIPVLLARLTLASLFEGDHRRAAAELLLLERLYPEAEGRLMGKQGPLASRLRELSSEAANWPAATLSSNWPTGGGSPSRNARAPRPFELGEIMWSTPFEPIRELETPIPGATYERLFPTGGWPGEPDSPLPFQVAIANGRVAIVEPRRIRVLDLESGAAAFGRDGVVWRAQDWQLDRPIHPGAPHAGVARFDVTIQRDRLLARVGPAITASPVADNVRGSALLAMDLNRQGRMVNAFPVVCRATDEAANPAGWCFEGAAPLLHEDSLLTISRWNDGVRTTCNVDCYGLSDGRRHWRTALGGGGSWPQRAQSPEDPPWRELSANQAALCDNRLYVCTQMGLMSCVDANSGDYLWATRYPSATYSPRKRHAHAARCAAPMILGDLVIVAPQDTGAIFAFDRYDGQLVWSTDPSMTSDVVHLLGGNGQHLVVSGDRLVWLDALTGSVVCRFPEGGELRPTRAAPGPSGCGRGLIAGDCVVWPTRDRLFAFELSPHLADSIGGTHFVPVARGDDNFRLRGLTGGNLAISRNVLLIATRERLAAVRIFQDSPLPDVAPSSP